MRNLLGILNNKAHQPIRLGFLWAMQAGGLNLTFSCSLFCSGLTKKEAANGIGSLPSSSPASDEPDANKSE